METDPCYQLNPSTLVRLHLSLLPEQVSFHPFRLESDSDLSILVLKSMWTEVQRKWGFSLIREVLKDQPERVQLRITQVEVSKPAHRAGVMNGDIIYQIYGCCTNPPIQLLFGIMRDSVAFEMTVIRTEQTELISQGPTLNSDETTNRVVNVGFKNEVSDENKTVVATKIKLASPPTVDDNYVKLLSHGAPSKAAIIIENDILEKQQSLESRKDIVASLEKQSLESRKDTEASLKDFDLESRVNIAPVGVEIVPAAPPPVMRHSTFDYGSIVTSKSKMSGLKTKQSSKLKRLYPDTALFIKRILKYHPPEVIQGDKGAISFYGAASHTQLSSDLEELPASFDSATEMRKLFSPILLAEGISTLKQEFLTNSDTSGIWSRDLLSLELMSCIPVDPTSTKTTTSTLRTYEVTFTVKLQSQGIPLSANYGELYALYSSRWTESRHICLGIAGHSHHTFLTDQKLIDDEIEDKFRVWICASDQQYQDTGWLADFELPQSNADGSFPKYDVLAINIGTVTDILRQYEGITSIAHVRQELQDVVYSRPMAPDTSAADLQVKKPNSLPSDIWESLLLNLNPYQASTVSKIMNGNQRGSCFLLQGPPGTGKTATIVGLVGALLNGSFSTNTIKTLGTKVQVGSTISKTSTSPVETPVSSRILLCAPSNQSVDDLAWKVQRSALGLNGKLGAFNLVRVGILPGEERHDGRGRKKKVGNFSSDERMKFLRAVNLELIVNEISAGREVKGFDIRSETDEKKYPGSSKRKRGSMNSFLERQKILSRSHVVCCTLSGAGSRTFIEACARDDFPEQEFDVVIIDEACQASEATCLIPFKFNPNLVVLVGDPQQLPVTILSKDAKRLLAHRSLFERLQLNNIPVHVLKIQYRMHDEIAMFPSIAFYDNELLPSDTLKVRQAPLWYHHRCFPPYLVWNTGDNISDSMGNSGSFSNRSEIKFILDLLKEFSKVYGHQQGISIGIITFYNDQVDKIKDSVLRDPSLNSWLSSRRIDLQISTVDGFQGCETDIAILSCVRAYQRYAGSNSRDDIGFLRDFRRLNVAITRAKFSLWIIGQCSTLAINPIWAALLQNARNRQLIARCEDFRRLSSLNNSEFPSRSSGVNQGKRKKKSIESTSKSNASSEF